MSLGNSIFHARKKSGLSKQEVAEKLGVSRQTISKWELDETLPDIRQCKRLAELYHLSLDELVDFDVELKEIERVIENTSEEKQKEINWTKVWGKKYPILLTYPQTVDVDKYGAEIRKLLRTMEKEYDFSSLDAMLVLKDIMAHVWNKGTSESITA